MLQKKVSIRTIEITPALKIEFAKCPPGTFKFSTRGTSLFPKTGRENVQVEFKKDFWISRTAVTTNQWNTILGKQNRFYSFRNDDTPVFGIDYSEASSFLTQLNVQWKSDGNKRGTFLFPNFLEWRYACEARTNDDEHLFWNGYEDFLKYAWFKDNSEGKMQKVAQKLANPWGIYDMYGSVLEMCIDPIVENGQEFIQDPQSEPEDRAVTVLGGSYLSNYEDCKSTKAHIYMHENSFVEPLGVRLLYRE